MSILYNRNRSGRGRAIRSTTALAILTALLVAGLTATTLAERVKTKSGQTFTGQIVEQDATKVVLKTMSGDMTIPMDTVLSIEKDGAPATTGTSATAVAPSGITPVPIDPAKAAESLDKAKKALVGGEWIKAGGLLEGLLALDDKSFGADDRMAATGALVTCYLQIKDPMGAAKALSRRAQLATDTNDKRRLTAAAEALRTLNTVTIGGKAVGRFEDVVGAAMIWKADQVFADAKELNTKAQRLNEPAMLERAAVASVKKLSEADVYVPGYSSSHKAEVLGVLVQCILDGATAAVEYCTKERPVLTQARGAAGVTPETAKEWNGRAGPYLSKRQAAEDALKNLKAFTTKYEMAALYNSSTAQIAELTKQLTEYQYYPAGTLPYSYSSYYYYYGTYPYGSSSTERIKITLK
jgi:hypothetical protein